MAGYLPCWSDLARERSIELCFHLMEEALFSDKQILLLLWGYAEDNPNEEDLFQIESRESAQKFPLLCVELINGRLLKSLHRNKNRNPFFFI